jgi:voltage-gated potassium channel
MASSSREREQSDVLDQIEDWLEMPMFILSLVWAGLLVVELTWGAGPTLNTAATLIWIVFLIEFAFRFVIAPRKLHFIRKSWLTLLTLAIPALRVFRVARVAYVLRAGRAIRGLTLARVITAFNRGLRSLQRTMGRFAFGYVATLTVLVTLLGAAGMYAFERTADGGGGLNTFGDALWFTAMLMTTSGSDYWPQSAEGRVLCFLLALYAFTIFGYVTATLATLLIGQHKPEPGMARLDDPGLTALREEIAALRRELRGA